MSPARFIDTHVHLDAEAFDSDREVMIERARAAGVTRFICIGASAGFESNERALQLAERFEFISATVGIHPHDASLPIDEARLRGLASHPKVVAIGETGLDYFRDIAPREAQQRWFRAHIALAIESHLPLVIHSREAGNDCLAILKEMNAQKVGGVFHCYSEDHTFAASLRDLGFFVSIPGILTFRKNDAYRSMVRSLPLDQILLETDAPYLAPEPYRGKRNEPAHMVQTAQVLAGLHDVSLDRIGEITSQNARRLFTRLPPDEG